MQKNASSFKQHSVKNSDLLKLDHHKVCLNHTGSLLIKVAHGSQLGGLDNNSG